MIKATWSCVGDLWKRRSVSGLISAPRRCSLRIGRRCSEAAPGMILEIRSGIVVGLGNSIAYLGLYLGGGLYS